MLSDWRLLMTIVGVELNTMGVLDPLGIVRSDGTVTIVGATRSGAVSIAVATARRALRRPACNPSQICHGSMARNEGGASSRRLAAGEITAAVAKARKPRLVRSRDFPFSGVVAFSGPTTTDAILPITLIISLETAAVNRPMTFTIALQLRQTRYETAVSSAAVAFKR